MAFDAVTNDTRFIWFGDAQREAALRIKSMYYEDMKCDVMQVAHHGVNGGSLELFELCNPKIAFFPVAESLYRSIANLEQNRYIVGSCERVLFAYDGTQSWTASRETGTTANFTEIRSRKQGYEKSLEHHD